jgi:anti-sigma factor RsiW
MTGNGNAPVTEADLHAYADGLLAEGRRGFIESYLATRPDESDRVRAWRRQAEGLRALYDGVLSEPIPAALPLAPPPRRPFPLRLAAAAALLLAGGGLGWTLRAALQPSRSAGSAAADAPQELARRAALAHAVYTPEVRHPVEVGADQEAHLVAWLSKRLGSPVRAPKLEEVGYNLVGGRLLPGDSGPVAHFMYQCSRGTRVTLYMRTEAAGNRETAFRYAEEGKVRVFYWVDRKLGYAISSADISKDDLFKVANVVYQQLNP